MPPPGSYALFVSTIEARKNHVLLMRVWQRLLNEMPSHAVPTLVFAGRVGWMVSDLMQQLDNTDWLDGCGVKLDAKGFVITGEDGRHALETCRDGVFAVGDVRCGSVKRVAAAVGEGSTAVSAIHQWLARERARLEQRVAAE